MTNMIDEQVRSVILRDGDQILRLTVELQREEFYLSWTEIKILGTNTELDRIKPLFYSRVHIELSRSTGSQDFTETIEGDLRPVFSLPVGSSERVLAMLHNPICRSKYIARECEETGPSISVSFSRSLSFWPTPSFHRHLNGTITKIPDSFSREADLEDLGVRINLDTEYRMASKTNPQAMPAELPVLRLTPIDNESFEIEDFNDVAQLCIDIAHSTLCFFAESVFYVSEKMQTLDGLNSNEIRHNKLQDKIEASPEANIILSTPTLPTVLKKAIETLASLRLKKFQLAHIIQTYSDAVHSRVLPQKLLLMTQCLESVVGLLEKRSDTGTKLLKSNVQRRLSDHLKKSLESFRFNFSAEIDTDEVLQTIETHYSRPVFIPLMKRILRCLESLNVPLDSWEKDVCEDLSSLIKLRNKLTHGTPVDVGDDGRNYRVIYNEYLRAKFLFERLFLDISGLDELGVRSHSTMEAKSSIRHSSNFKVQETKRLLAYPKPTA